MVQTKDRYRVALQLTEEEFLILKEYSRLEGTPMGTVLIDVLRKGKTFSTLSKFSSVAKGLKSMKEGFFSRLAKTSDS